MDGTKRGVKREPVAGPQWPRSQAKLEAAPSRKANSLKLCRCLRGGFITEPQAGPRNTLQ